MAVDNAILDGEIVWLDKDGKTSFQNLQNAMKDRDSSRLVYYAFDLLFLNGEDLRSSELIERKEHLEKTVQSLQSTIIRYSEHMEGKAKEFFKAACAYNLEGTYLEK